MLIKTRKNHMKPLSATLSTSERPYTLPAGMTERVHELMEAARVPGLSLAIYSRDEILYCEGLGVKSTEGGQAVDEETIFCAASLGKPAFAYALLQLVDRGLMGLDDPLYQYLPHPDLQHDERHRLLTARMVLEHTTGLPNVRKDGRLDFEYEPGERHEYSGEAFNYLMRVLEKLTGQDLETMMQALVFQPLGMTNSSYLWQERFEENYAVSHHDIGWRFPRYRPTDYNAAYSLQTTARDYAQLMMALLNGQGLKEETARAFFQPAVELARLPDGSSASWGLGIGLLNTAQERYCWQWGGHNWFASFTISLLDSGLGLIYLSNAMSGFGIAKALIESCFGAEKTPTPWLGDYDYQAPHKDFLNRLLRDFDFNKAVQPFLDEGGERYRPELLDEDSVEQVGLLMYEVRDTRLAQQIFEVNQRTHPHSAQAQENYGLACLSNREQAKAARHFKRAYELDPNRDYCRHISAQLEGHASGNVTFRLKGHYHAKSISVAGDFNGWNSFHHPFRREEGEWVCHLQLAPGTYEYKLIVDRVWILDPHNPRSVYREEHNSVLEVQ